MKTFLRITLLFASVLMVATTATMAQRVITGIVYMDGKPAAGIEVLAHKGGSMMTSFDGQYKVEASEKTKWIKFTFIDESKKLDISGQSGDHFDFAFTGEIPSGEATDEGAVNLSLQEQLVAAGDKEYMNQLSLYKEFYKQKDIESAYPHWKNLYKKYPKSTVNVYIHGAKIHQMLIENAENADEKEMYFNDYMNLFDKRIKYYGQKGYILGRKAAAWLEYKIKDQSLEGQEQIDALKTGYNWLNESVDLQKNESELAVIVLLIIGEWKIFTKAGQPGWAVLIPFYNLYVFLQIVGRPTWWMLILLFIPVVNLIFLVIMTNDLSKSFGQGIGFTLGLIFLSPIFILLLGFGDYKYIGKGATL